MGANLGVGRDEIPAQAELGRGTLESKMNAIVRATRPMVGTASDEMQFVRAVIALRMVAAKPQNRNTQCFPIVPPRLI